MADSNFFEIGFDHRTYSKAKIRKFVADAISKSANLDRKMHDRILSVVDELCSNALNHGSREGDEVKLAATIGSREIEITVDDKGTGVHPKTADEIRRIVAEKRKAGPLANKTKRGRGLPWIVTNWMDKVEFIDLLGGGIRVQVVKYL
ncbi:MAG: ATP-binding protein [Patescibacteria group bacterium]|nr:ATP-binding protein [Patescibacteria group bacterium]